ncbi:hypothetical protein [Streptomyces sp. NPDC057094]|uniref:hypothetical protein n=1 Tax=unclassified Streptomyces TaxID=2593676 RepID=UPI0036278096
MSQSPPPRAETRVRLDVPTAGQGQDRGDVLVRCVLTSRTVLRVERVRAVRAAGPVRDVRTGGATGGEGADR